MPTLKRFEDYDSKIRGRWFEPALADLVAWGIIRGYEDGTLRPYRWKGFTEVCAMQHRVIMREPEKRAVHDLLKYTCLLGGGSGFWLPDWHVGTCAHVVFEPEDLEPRDFRVNGNPGLGFAPPIAGGLEGEIVRADHQNDVALLKIDPPKWKDEIDYHCFTVEEMEDTVSQGDKVITAGQPYRQPWDVADGMIRSTNRSVNVWQYPQFVYGTTLASNPGNSGGPITLLDGRLVGLVNAGVIKSHLYNFLVPAYHIWRLWEGLAPARMPGVIER